MGVSWTLSSDTLDMEIRSEIDGYLSLGFASSVGIMSGTDAIIAYKDSSSAMQIGAYTLQGHGSPSISDAKSNYFTGTPTAQHDGTIMSARFKRSLIVSNGQNIDAESGNSINLAYHLSSGVNGNYFPHHTSRSSVFIDFNTGCAQVELKSKSSWVPIYVAAPILVIGAVLIMIMSSMAMNSPMQNMSKMLRTRTILPPSETKGTILNQVTMDIWPTIKGYGVAEIFALGFVIISLVAFLLTMEADRNSIALALGWCNIVTLSMIVVPVTKHSLLLYMFGVPFERAVKYHRMLARIFTLTTVIHLVAVVKKTGSFQNALDFHANKVEGVYGFVAFVFTILIGITAVEDIRRQLWELFYFSHVMFVPLVLGFSILHVKKRTSFFSLFFLSVFYPQMKHTHTHTHIIQQALP